MRFINPKVVVLLLGLASLCSSAFGGVFHLTQDGTLYRVLEVDGGLALTWAAPDGEPHESLIPQSEGAVAHLTHVDVDENTNTPFVVWQQGTDENATVRIAAFQQGSWAGPETLAGGVTSPATNPVFLIRRESVVIPGNEEEEATEVTEAFIHVAWWERAVDDEIGIGIYSAIPILLDGSADYAKATRLTLGDLLPFGIGCHGIDDATQFAFPRLFVDPQRGTLHVFSTDFSNCMFIILELLGEPGEIEPITNRRRVSIVAGRTEMIATNPSLPLGKANVEVGSDLSLVVFWDHGEAIDYSVFGADMWSQVRSIQIDADIDHENAAKLIRDLMR